MFLLLAIAGTATALNIAYCSSENTGSDFAAGMVPLVGSLPKFHAKLIEPNQSPIIFSLMAPASRPAMPDTPLQSSKVLIAGVPIMSRPIPHQQTPAVSRVRDTRQTYAVHLRIISLAISH